MSGERGCGCCIERVCGWMYGEGVSVEYLSKNKECGERVCGWVY